MREDAELVPPCPEVGGVDVGVEVGVGGIIGIGKVEVETVADKAE
jgi:hypothetical protein